jgi:uncharacterized protein DUF5678
MSTSSTSPDAERQFELEEQAYWQQRPALIERYPGKWVAIVGGKVVAVGDQMNRTAAEAYRKTKIGVMFVARMGDEDVEFRIRQVTKGHFEQRYQHPMPMVTAPVSDLAEAAQLVHIAAHPILVTTDCRDDIPEDILGRDVTNEFALTICPKHHQVDLDWVEEP